MHVRLDNMSTSLPSRSLSLSQHGHPRRLSRAQHMSRFQRCRLVCRPSYQCPRWVGSKSAVLTLLWNTLMFGYFGTLVDGLSRCTLASPSIQPYASIIINR